MEFSANGVNPVFAEIMTQLRKAAEDLPKTQQRMMSLTGVAWSDDGMVKVVVGPRGQLVDLEIDPRVFRRPDAAELRATILSTSAAAIKDVTGQAQEIMAEQIPPDIAELQAKYQSEGGNAMADMLRSDADIYAEQEDDR